MRRQDGDFYKATEIAVFFEVNRATVDRWRRAGRLTFVRLPPGRFLYPAGLVNELLARPGDRAAQIPGQLTLPA